MLTFRLPEEGTSLGGTMALQGGNLTLACFHGINFRSKSWAIFTLDEPFINFATDAVNVENDGMFEDEFQCGFMTFSLLAISLTPLIFSSSFFRWC